MTITSLPHLLLIIPSETKLLNCSVTVDAIVQDGHPLPDGLYLFPVPMIRFASPKGKKFVIFYRIVSNYVEIIVL